MTKANSYPDLNAAAFQVWCHTQENLASGVRRVRMRQVYNLCLYRRRTEPKCFVPDLSAFPEYHQPLQPYIFSEDEIARLLRAASGLNRVPSSPLRPEMIRLAIMLLFTTGIRRGELLRLILSDYSTGIRPYSFGSRSFTSPDCFPSIPILSMRSIGLWMPEPGAGCRFLPIHL